jgi:hypothetical protein
VPANFHGGASNTNIRGGTVLVEEVSSRTQVVDVGKVREDLQLRWEPKRPSHAHRCVPRAWWREHVVGLARAQTGRRGRVDGAPILAGTKGGDVDEPADQKKLVHRSRGEASQQVEAQNDHGGNRGVSAGAVGEEGVVALSERGARQPLV